METILVELFRAAADAASFRRSVMSLNGAFDFSSADMIELGTAYFEKHPDRPHDRDMDEVRLGYELVRICVIEKMVLAVPTVRRPLYRTALNDATAAGRVADDLARAIGADGLAVDISRLRAALDDVRRAIDEIPKGMIKERFVGGISSLSNILYVLKMKVRPPVP